MSRLRQLVRWFLRLDRHEQLIAESQQRRRAIVQRQRAVEARLHALGIEADVIRRAKH